MSQAPGEGKNNALSSLSSGIALTDLNKALTLIEGLPPSIHNQKIMNIAYSSVSKKPLEVESLIERLDLNDEAAKKIRKWAKNILSNSGG